LRFTIDALGRITENVYFEDTVTHAIGLVRETIQYADTIDGLTRFDYHSVQTYVAGLTSPTTRNNYFVYDSQQRLRYTVNADGEVARFDYDDFGNVIRSTRYAASFNANGQQPTVSEMDPWAGDNSVGSRTTRNYYNSRNELRFTVDAEGYVVQFEADPLGRQSNTYRYENQVSATNSWTIDDVIAADLGASIETRVNYDAFGNLNLSLDGTNSRTVLGFTNSGFHYLDIRGEDTDDEIRTRYHTDGANRITKETRYLGNSNVDAYTA
ncbi:hypothetical protein RMQ97_15485, partial [Maricaulis sp. D1M11]|uniref:hypothetical protein n=1 Tax=Maricaulis sp. D1M11 TaxID=3076117 RepID=UPI0039B3B27E